MITDFGFAKGRSLAASLTRTGAVFGTLYYMAPEQCQDAKHVDSRADVFSLGVILYESLTGQRPFQGSNAMALTLALQKHEPPPPSKLAPGISPALDALVLQALAKLPAERPSAEEFASRLTSSSQPAPALPASAEREPEASRSTAIALAAVVGLLVVSALVVALALRGRGTSPAAPETAAAVEPPADVTPSPIPESAPPSQVGPSAERLLDDALQASRGREPYEVVAGVLANAAKAAQDDSALRTRVAAEEILLAWRRARYRVLDELTARQLDDPTSELSPAFLRLYRARALLELGRQEEGLELYRGLARQEPGRDVWLLCVQAEIVVLQGQADPGPASRVLREDPGLVDGLVLRARATLRVQPREAQRDLARAAELAPDDMHVFFWWGLADAGLRDWEGKAAHLQLAIELSEPRPDPTALLWRGHTLWLIDRFAEAEADLDRLLEQDPNDLEGLVWRAGCWYASGEEDRAREAWRELDRARGDELRELLQAGGRRVEVGNLAPWIRQALGEGR